MPFEARAERVVVAAGGINGDMARVKQNWHRDWGKPPEVILNGSHKYADGRLHDAVSAAGGRVTHLENMWNYASGVHHYRPRKPLHGLSLVPPKSALWLNWRGERILPPLVSGFDTRALMRTICKSRTYQHSLLTNQWNEDDEVNYSHALARRVPAEVLYDAIHRATGLRRIRFERAGN